MTALEELREVRGLVAVINRLLDNYRKVGVRSGDELAMKRIAGRVEEHLTNCLREACDELSGERTATLTFDQTAPELVPTGLPIIPVCYECNARLGPDDRDPKYCTRCLSNAAVAVI